MNGMNIRAVKTHIPGFALFLKKLYLVVLNGDFLNSVFLAKGKMFIESIFIESTGLQYTV